VWLLSECKWGKKKEMKHFKKLSQIFAFKSLCFRMQMTCLISTLGGLLEYSKWGTDWLDILLKRTACFPCQNIALDTISMSLECPSGGSL
jgi:hypothetical protein